MSRNRGGNAGTRRWLWAAGLAVVLILALGVGLAAAWLWRSYRAADYPGAARVADHSLYRLVPNLYYRRDTSYRTTDPFPRVYNWYSQSFDMGPEARAQSACITLERARSWWIVHSSVIVDVCDTPSGRMMFVQRAFTFRFR